MNPVKKMRYKDYEWDDVKPIAADEDKDALVQIMYSDAYKHTTGLLRAVMATGEASERVLDLTSDVISMNAAHYTVWHHRLQTLIALRDQGICLDQPNCLPVLFLQALGGQADDELEVDLTREVVEDYEWLNQVTLDTAKNFQIWHYRQCLMPKDVTTMFARMYFKMERYVVEMVLGDEPKNYHAWSHLQWVVRHTPKEFAVPVEEEIQYAEYMLSQDVYNNSAWSFRFFTLERAEPTEEMLQAELAYAQFAITEVPQNEAAWNFIVAVYEKYYTGAKAAEGQKQLEELCLKMAPVDDEAAVFRSTHALETLADLYEAQGRLEQARKTLALLQTYIPMRKGYWSFRMHQLTA